MLKSRNNYQIAFDPGMTGCGYSIWNNGIWQCVGTITPRGSDHLSKLKDLQVKATDFFTLLLADPPGVVERIAIEEWEGYFPRFKVATMLKSAEGRGLLISVCYRFCDDIRFVSKGKTKKDQAQMIALRSGIKGSAHAIDSFHLGLLAGFGEVIGKKSFGQ